MKSHQYLWLPLWGCTQRLRAVRCALLLRPHRGRKGLSLYLGTLRPLVESLLASLEGHCPGIAAFATGDNPLRSCPRRYGGMFTGIPAVRNEENAPPPEQMESICRGMLGRRFSYIVLAAGLSNIAVTFGHSRLLEEMARVFELINRSVSGGAQGNISAQHQDFACKNYFDNLEALEQQLKDGMARGMWRVNGYFAADTPADARQLGNLVSRLLRQRRQARTSAHSGLQLYWGGYSQRLHDR